ncbi:hypothetical protein J2067_004160 [Erwinia rhapontici]|nr:hypothetical protein [Erwinia rhapontici]
MSLNDSKIRNLKPSARYFKVSDSHNLYLLLIQAVHVFGISNIASIEKNPASVKVLIRLCLRLMPANSLTVLGNCWRRISILHNRGLLEVIMYSFGVLTTNAGRSLKRQPLFRSPQSGISTILR